MAEEPRTPSLAHRFPGGTIGRFLSLFCPEERSFYEELLSCWNLDPHPILVHCVGCIFGSMFHSEHSGRRPLLRLLRHFCHRVREEDSTKSQSKGRCRGCRHHTPKHQSCRCSRLQLLFSNGFWPLPQPALRAADRGHHASYAFIACAHVAAQAIKLPFRILNLRIISQFPLSPKVFSFHTTCLFCDLSQLLPSSSLC